MAQQDKTGAAAVRVPASADNDLPMTGNASAESARASDIRQLQRELAEQHAGSPILTGGDVDANWQAAESVGDETPGGHMATPDQDNVDEIGRAYGIELQDNQELHTHDELLAKRDAQRWELRRSSADGDTL